MWRFVLTVSFVLICCTVPIHAQYIVVGPADDETVIDTSYRSLTGQSETEQLALRFGDQDATKATAGVSVINLSQLDCSLFPYNCLYVDATDNLGNPVPGLSADSFCLYQDGVPVGNFTVEQLTVGDCITSVCLVVDVSGSMAENHKLDSAKAALHRFVNNMDSYDQTAIVTFSTCWYQLVNFTSNKTTLHNAINGLTAGGNTAAFDGIYKGVDITRLQLGTKAVIAFTDGLENRSQSCSPNPPDGVSDNTYKDDSTAICNLANLAGVPIYTFNLGPIENTWYNPQALKAFANGTGGFWGHAPTPSGIDSLYTLIKQRLCSRYYICYTSPDTIQNGDTHWVKVCKKTGGTCSPCDSSSCQEAAPPVIARTPSTLQMSDTCQPYTSPLSICAWVTDRDTPKPDLTVTLYYRLGDVSYTSIPMTATGGASDSTFCATIPAGLLACESQLDYYITASDGQATVSAPAVDPQVSPYTIDICGTHPPVANAGPDQIISQCSPAQICLPASCTDPDGNLKACELVSGPGTYDGSEICFLPNGTSDYRFILKATDSCDLVDYDTVVVFYTLNNPPVADAGRDSTVLLCTPQQICWSTACSDPDGNLSTCELISGPGEYTGGQICFTPSSSGSYEFVLQATDACGMTSQDTAVITVALNEPPACQLPNDTAVFLCQPSDICLPVEILDPDCDVVSVTTNIGQYSGTKAGFDQVSRISQLGGTITQIGGGAPGKALTVASDFVAPVNSQSGVSVTLPNFVFADHIVNAGSFPTGLEPGNSATHLLNAPTDLTFTLPGAGGPDGGSGDGSVAFAPGNNCVMGFPELITTCNGANVDFVVFTSKNGGGVAQLDFRLNGTVVHTITRTIPGGPAASGSGGVTFDLPDGLTFNEIRIQCTSGNFEIDAFAARTEPSPTTEDVCFLADTAGVYEVIVTVTDACDNVVADTTYVTVSINRAPVADAGQNQSFFACQFYQICLPIGFSDPDNNIVLTEKTSGPGTLNNGMICFTPTSAGVYTFVVHVKDACGLEDYDTVAVNINSNSPPVAVDPSPASVWQCTPQEVCYDLSATDPNGGTLTWSHLAGVGTITPQGRFCYTPTASGTHGAALVVTDSCGAADTTSFVITVVLNTAPVAVDPPGPLTVSQCTPEELCYQFSASDAQGGPLVWSLLSGQGTLTSAGRWCFTPTASGSYTAQVAVTDSCGLADTTSKTFEVTVNGAPTIAFGADSSLSLCQPRQICLTYSVGDPQGMTGLVEELVSGYGTLDTLTNKVCFTPTTTGTYEFVVRVKDNCLAIDQDTILVNVTFGQFADIACPAQPINVSLCSIDTVCQQLTITPPSANVSVSFGTYSNGELCFRADTSGTYNVRVIAASQCSSDTCMVTFNVSIGQAAQIDCPAPKSVFICEADTVCIPVGVVGSGAVVTVSPIGVYQAGSLCFPADTAGHYSIQMIASTSCGTDTCMVVADVVINRRPVATDPVTPVDTFLCAQGQICRQFAATDADGGPLTWSRLSGSGTVTSSGQWCFTANSAGAYSVIAKVTDSCGAADTTTLTYNVGVNVAPIFAFPADTTAFLCGAGQVCVPFTLSDANNNLASVELLEGTGIIFTSNNLLCFAAQNPGAYRFIARAIDSCNAQVTDTITVTVRFNTAPVVDAGTNMTRFQCEPSEICWPVSASDVDGNLTSVQLVSGPGTYNGSTICFTPTGTLDYEFVLKATDACGAEDWDTVVIRYTLNSPPVADAGRDTTIFLCSAQTVCWPASCTDVDGNLTGGTLISGPGTYDGSSICFMPSATGSYTFVLQATDACGETDMDTVVANVTINSTPVCHVPNDTLIFQCTPAPVCLPVFGEDADGNLDHCEIISGQGTLIGGNWCYTPVASQSVTVVVRCIDDCGAQCESQFTVEFEINQAPTIAFGGDLDLFQCSAEQICLPYTVSDENDPRPRTVTLVSGPGTLDQANSQVCFTPSGSGDNTFVIRVQDECGKFDQDTVNVSVTLNSPPAANAGNDLDLFVCDADTTICWPASCTDPDDNLTDCVFNGPGTYDGSQICFSPAAGGSYLFTLRAVDECGEETVDSVVIDITLNTAPTVEFGADSALQLCQPQPICVGYTATDPDGLDDLVETLVSGYGSLNPVTNQVCFTPTTAGSYEIVVRATDPCGAYAEDTIVVDVMFGSVAAVECPAGPLDISLCAAETVCQAINIAPEDADVSVSYGTYADGELCFLADTSGVYSIKIIAAADCGVDTCQYVFNVSIGSAAQIDCPDPIERFLCTPGSVCFPIGVMGTGVNVTVSPIGSYTRGDVCFPADTTGHYELTIIAETPCGSDTCLAVIDVTINSAPVAVDPPVVDTFLCAGAPICRQFAANDADGDPLTWSRVSGSGTVTADGLWCFTANTPGTYTVTARVADPCGATDQITATYNVTMNTRPTVTLGIDTLIAMCQSQQVCLPYQVTDPNNNVVLEEIFPSEYAPGLNTDLNQFCFTPTVAGPIRFIIRATDACGAVDEDTINVAIMFNHAPVANAGTDVNVFQCQPAQIVIPAGCTDSDNNLVSCTEITGTAAYDGSSLRFTPTASGVYTMILRAEDACGAVDLDTVVATVRINSAPSCQIPEGTMRFFQCQPTQVSLPVGATDIDGNFDHCEIIRGPGSIIGGQWVYTPTADQTVTVAIMCLDQCGASCVDSFTVAFDINSKPVANAGADKTFFLCASGQVCWDAGASDPDGNLASREILSPAGAVFQGNQICMNVDFGSGTDRVFDVIVKATDSCGATDLDTATIRVNFNRPPEISLPPNFTAYLESVGNLCFSAGITDRDENLATVVVSPIGAYNAATDQICFNADSAGTYCFEVRATDQCGAQSVDSVCIEVQIDECVHVQIAKVHEAIQGQHKLVDIYLNGSGHELGGYDFLIYYDPTALTPSGVVPGDLLTACGWEYFNYRFGPEGNCGNGCPSSLLRIVGIAETNNGAYHPGCFLDGLTGSLATIDFLVSNDRNLECQFAPVRFFWIDCGDNVFSSRNGDTLWVSRTVYDFELNNITDISHGFPGYVGVPDSCLAGDFEGKPVPIRCVDLTNGGVDIICADSIDARGDINLNGIAHEVADAVMFTNYFVVGLSAFSVNVDGSVAASDVNGDGLPLTVADLVYLIRVVVGDALALPKVVPGQFEQVDIALVGDQLTIGKSATRIGAIFVVLEGDAKPTLAESAANMELRYNFDGTDTRVLIYNMDGKAFVESGAVLNINGSNAVKTIEVGGYDGQVVQAKLTSMPRSFALSQNYPNPFNPVTTIEYALPIAGKWNLTVYNILGQEVESWSGESEPGYYKVEWDAGRYASGVYLYRLMAGGFSATRKMVLLK